MNIAKWVAANTTDLSGKVVVITGASGGLGSLLCEHLVHLHAEIVMLDHSLQKSLALKAKLLAKFPDAKIQNRQIDLSSLAEVKTLARELQDQPLDYLVLNAGVYHVPLKVTDSGYNNIFQVNFFAPYYLVNALLPKLKAQNSKVVVVGSIAHNYSHLDLTDVDFSHRQSAAKIYGNAKRFLMFAFYELMCREKLPFAVVHPGVTLTLMTNHYPKAINWLVKIGVKLLFPKPEVAVLSLLSGLFRDCGEREWLGPRTFNIWGKPKLQRLHTCSAAESKQIFDLAETMLKKELC